MMSRQFGAKHHSEQTHACEKCPNYIQQRVDSVRHVCLANASGIHVSRSTRDECASMVQ
jgi:hypothetical protein